MAYTAVPNPKNTALNSVRYDGNSSTQTITGVNFNPDLTIIKNYVGTTESWSWFDKCRGATKWLATQSDGAQTTTADTLTSWNSDGFALGASDQVNGTSGRKYVSWNFKGGGDGVTNSVGDTDSLVSVNTASGFSVVTWTGTGSNTTVGHGLGAVPKWILTKRTDAGSSDWELFPTVFGGTGNTFIKVNGTGAEYSSSTYMNATDPTTTVFSLGTDTSWNASGGTYVAYCFAPVKGFSWFPNQVGGNASSDGYFYYTGFRPQIVIIKGNHGSYATNWYWYGSNNQGHGNPVDYNNVSSIGFTDSSSVQIKMFANGFKVAGASDDINNSGTWKLSAAFAAQPTISTDGLSANAFGSDVNEG